MTKYKQSSIFFIITSLVRGIDPSSRIKENDIVKNNEKESHKKYYIERNLTNSSTYALSCDLQNFSYCLSLCFTSNQMAC